MTYSCLVTTDYTLTIWTCAIWLSFSLSNSITLLTLLLIATQHDQQLIDHRLRGSASPVNVITATGFVNGKGQFSTPHRIDTPQPITKNLSQVITSATPTAAKLGAHRSTGASGHMKWVKYNQIIFIYAPFWHSMTGETRRQIFTHNGSNDVDSRKDVPFGDLFTWLPI